jgi:hypothetical protein
VDWALVHVNWSEGWIGAWLDWGVVGLGAAGLGTIVADGKRRRVKVGWAGTSQVARRCIRVGVWEGHRGGARKGGWIGTTGEHVSLDWMPSVCVRYITNMEEIQKFRFKANPNLRDVVKNQKQRMTPKININIIHVHK